ncbi:hypothetical protein VIGAN_02324100 [Vigna angularis var. angularis]|uniref:Fe2OG dioxygenase domain-containing protein n=1 Tax=Vigna angularis var. angularis TaxID=157739 RepID=A0A0S3RHZ4_PHAAN|nr:hypothetical protein VIGAN_02324100 [Vigna angularis var. angularis]
MAPVPNSPVKVGHIDDVQELRKTKPRTVPQRFVRDVTERPTLPTTPLPPPDTHMPIIDFSKLTKGNKDEIFNLATACEEWGFFQVINHEIDLNLLERIENLSREFFMLPLEEKQKYPMAPGTVQGYGQAFVFSEDQKLDWCNMFALGLEPQYVRNPNLWPTRPERFSETVEEYSREIRKLCYNLLKDIALGLDLKGDVFEKMFGVSVQAIRMNYYPPCSRPDLVLGLSPHSDGSALTVLQQAKGGPVGLQIFKNNTWLPIQPIPNALVINIGDTIEVRPLLHFFFSFPFMFSLQDLLSYTVGSSSSSFKVSFFFFHSFVIPFLAVLYARFDLFCMMQVLTNGKYRSVEHRAVAHEEKDRLSIVTFFAPSYEVELGPMPEFVDEKHPCMYRRYNHGEYSKHYVTNKLQGKKTLDFAKIQTKNTN